MAPSNHRSQSAPGMSKNGAIAGWAPASLSPNMAPRSRDRRWAGGAGSGTNMEPEVEQAADGRAQPCQMPCAQPRPSGASSLLIQNSCRRWQASLPGATSAELLEGRLCQEAQGHTQHVSACLSHLLTPLGDSSDAPRWDLPCSRAGMMEAQRGKVTGPRSHSKDRAGHQAVFKVWLSIPDRKLASHRARLPSRPAAVDPSLSLNRGGLQTFPSCWRREFLICCLNWSNQGPDSRKSGLGRLRGDKVR